MNLFFHLCFLSVYNFNILFFQLFKIFLNVFFDFFNLTSTHTKFVNPFKRPDQNILHLFNLELFNGFSITIVHHEFYLFFLRDNEEQESATRWPLYWIEFLQLNLFKENNLHYSFDHLQLSKKDVLVFDHQNNVRVRGKEKWFLFNVLFLPNANWFLSFEIVELIVIFFRVILSIWPSNDHKIRVWTKISFIDT